MTRRQAAITQACGEGKFAFYKNSKLRVEDRCTQPWSQCQAASDNENGEGTNDNISAANFYYHTSFKPDDLNGEPARWSPGQHSLSSDGKLVSQDAINIPGKTWKTHTSTTTATQI